MAALARDPRRGRAKADARAAGVGAAKEGRVRPVAGSSRVSPAPPDSAPVSAAAARAAVASPARSHPVDPVVDAAAGLGDRCASLSAGARSAIIRKLYASRRQSSHVPLRGKRVRRLTEGFARRARIPPVDCGPRARRTEWAGKAHFFFLWSMREW